MAVFRPIINAVLGIVVAKNVRKKNKQHVDDLMEWHCAVCDAKDVAMDEEESGYRCNVCGYDTHATYEENTRRKIVLIQDVSVVIGNLNEQIRRLNESIMHTQSGFTDPHLDTPVIEALQSAFEPIDYPFVSPSPLFAALEALDAEQVVEEIEQHRNFIDSADSIPVSASGISKLKEICETMVDAKSVLAKSLRLTALS